MIRCFQLSGKLVMSTPACLDMSAVNDKGYFGMSGIKGIGLLGRNSFAHLSVPTFPQGEPECLKDLALVSNPQLMGFQLPVC
jgi:hypothetical protein